MKLYLMRHAEPESTGTDPSLSSNGETQAQTLGDMLAKLIPAGDVIRVLTSPLKRARQTAHIVRIKLRQTAKPTVLSAPTNNPASDVDRLMTALRSAAGPLPTIPPGPAPQHIILVWHLPAISGVLNRLTGETLEWLDIHGMTAHVESSDSTIERGTGEFRWVILPKLILRP